MRRYLLPAGLLAIGLAFALVGLALIPSPWALVGALAGGVCMGAAGALIRQ